MTSVSVDKDVAKVAESPPPLCTTPPASLKIQRAAASPSADILDQAPPRMFWRIVIGAVVVLFLVMWVRAVIDVFVRRPDLSGVGKAAWAIGMLVVPFVGLLIYTMLRPADSQIASHRRRRS